MLSNTSATLMVIINLIKSTKLTTFVLDYILKKDDEEVYETGLRNELFVGSHYLIRPIALKNKVFASVMLLDEEPLNRETMMKLAGSSFLELNKKSDTLKEYRRCFAEMS